MINHDLSNNKRQKKMLETIATFSRVQLRFRFFLYVYDQVDSLQYEWQTHLGCEQWLNKTLIQFFK